jgi:large subunit ribosomal protein L21
MYAIVKTGGKQYRVEEGQWLLVERLPAEDGASIALEPLLIVDGSDVVDGAGLDEAQVEAKVLAHERGPKLRVVKFKPKRGYKRHNGHRQDLTRIQVTGIKLGGRSASNKESAASPAPVAAQAPAATPAPVAASGTAPAAEVAENFSAPEAVAATEAAVTPDVGTAGAAAAGAPDAAAGAPDAAAGAEPGEPDAPPDATEDKIPAADAEAAPKTEAEDGA